MKNSKIIITCEHGGNKIPAEYQKLFTNNNGVLDTHRGYDLGVWSLAGKFAEELNAPLFRTDITRLLVDVNRSLWRKTLFSEFTKVLNKNDRQKILNQYYYPHRIKVSKTIEELAKTGKNIIHIAVHSFTPILRNMKRNNDISFLYNPERINEKQFCRIWKKECNTILPQMKVRFNYPYRGKPDGLPAHFRKILADDQFIGIELEINQKYVSESGSFSNDVQRRIVDSFKSAYNNFSWHT